jgi:hypothetical protein
MPAARACAVVRGQRRGAAGCLAPRFGPDLLVEVEAISIGRGGTTCRETGFVEG